MAEPTTVISEPATPVEPGVPVPSPTPEVDGGSPSPAPEIDPFVEPTPSPGFNQTAPEVWRDAAWAKDIKDANALWDKAGNLQKVVGKKGVVLPGADDPADVARAFKELGRPDTPGEYDLTFEAPDTPRWDAQLQEDMTAVLHNAGLNGQQVDIVLKGYAEKLVDDNNRMEANILENREQVRTALQEEFGNAFKHKTTIANLTAESLLGEQYSEFETMKMADGTPLGDNPLLIKVFAAIGEMTGERQGIPSAGMGGNAAALTPAVAQAEYAQFRKDNADALTNNGHPEHDAAVEKLFQLNQMANPEPQE